MADAAGGVIIASLDLKIEKARIDILKRNAGIECSAYDCIEKYYFAAEGQSAAKRLNWQVNNTFTALLSIVMLNEICTLPAWQNKHHCENSRQASPIPRRWPAARRAANIHRIFQNAEEAKSAMTYQRALLIECVSD